MHSDLRMAVAAQRLAALRQEADDWRRAREAKAAKAGSKLLPSPAETANVTLRLDRAGDLAALHQLAAMNQRRLREEAHVVAEVEGKIVGALPLAGGVPLVDLFVRTAHLVPLLELRAAQIRRARDLRSPRRIRLVPRVRTEDG